MQGINPYEGAPAHNRGIECAPRADFGWENFGSVTILTPFSVAAFEWVAENLPDDYMTWGQHGIVIEPRYVSDIMRGILRDGLRVS